MFGIDGMVPDLFEQWIDELPNLKRLVDAGMYARMETVKPPISIAAWTSLLSGKDPSQTGMYNYVKRLSKDKTDMQIVNSTDIQCDMLWDVLARQGKRSIVQGVISSTPVRPIDGVMIGGILTPSFDEEGLYPYDMRDEILEAAGGKYLFDVSDFTTTTTFRKFSHDDLIPAVYAVSDSHHKVLKHLITTQEWDLCLYTGYGSDRFHHRLWRFLDEQHVKYEDDPKYKNVVKDFYIYLDTELGEILKLLPDDTHVVVMSDHGMNRLNGRINLNDWLIQEGYLVMSDEFMALAADGPVAFKAASVDWSKTRAFATSAYEALLFINRDIVSDDEYDSLCDELATKIKQIPNKGGETMNTKVYMSKNEFKAELGENAPDMMVYFDNLYWGTNCDIGNDGLYSWRNLVGADDALHGREGVCIISGGKTVHKQKSKKVDILDITPTVLDMFCMTQDDDMSGSVIDYT